MASSQNNTSYLVPESERQRALILAWPSVNHFRYTNAEHMKSKHFDVLTENISTIAEAVANFQEVVVAVDLDRYHEARQRLCTKTLPHRIWTHVAGRGMDVDMRDIAPAFVMKPGPQGNAHNLLGIELGYNADMYRIQHAACKMFPSEYLSELSVPTIQPHIAVDGREFDVDGDGTMIASKAIYDMQHPMKDQMLIEMKMERVLGPKKIIWLPSIGTNNKRTLTSMVRFVIPGVILLSRPTGHHADIRSSFEKIYRILTHETDSRGRDLIIIQVSEADLARVDPTRFHLNQNMHAALRSRNMPMPLMSYVTFVLVNNAVLVPQFGDELADQSALDVFQRLFGGQRTMVPLNAQALALWGSSLYSVTRHLPEHGGLAKIATEMAPFYMGCLSRELSHLRSTLSP